MSGKSERDFKREEVTRIVNDALAKMEKYGKTGRHEMIQVLETLKVSVQKFCSETDGMQLNAQDAEDRKKIYWLLGELEKRLNGPARNFIASCAVEGASATKSNASIQAQSDNNGE